MKNSYIPSPITIERIEEETNDTKTLFFDRNIGSRPGQFIEISLLGYGEAPISVNSTSDENLRLTIRSVGNLTRAIQRKKPGDNILIRGPFGRGWPVEESIRRGVLFVAGGIGLAPLRPVIIEILKNREKYGKIALLYGARSPELIIHKRELGEWANEMDVMVTVDACDRYDPSICKAWKGDVGVVTDLFDKYEISHEIAMVCGPPVMMKFAVKALLKREFSADNIYVSLERHMKCGIGMCGHCQIGGHYVCKDGPVFAVSEFRKWAEKPEEMEGLI